MANTEPLVMLCRVTEMKNSDRTNASVRIGLEDIERHASMGITVSEQEATDIPFGSFITLTLEVLPNDYAPDPPF